MAPSTTTSLLRSHLGSTITRPILVQKRCQIQIQNRSPARVVQERPFSLSIARGFPKANAQDRESIDTEATEYTKSGTDDAAAHSKEAFDPKSTRPEKERGQSEAKDNTLDVSPANPEVSKPRKPTEGGAENSGKEGGS